MLILILMSKIIFIKYVPPVRPKLVPKLKVLRIYWNLAHSIIQICQSWFLCKKLFLWIIYHLLGPCWSQLKMLRIYWILPYLIFQTSRSWFWWQKSFLSNIHQLLGPNWSQNEKCSELTETSWKLKFDKNNNNLDLTSGKYLIFFFFF